jgi:hypothetical protein
MSVGPLIMCKAHYLCSFCWRNADKQEKEWCCLSTVEKVSMSWGVQTVRVGLAAGEEHGSRNHIFGADVVVIHSCLLECSHCIQLASPKAATLFVS